MHVNLLGRSVVEASEFRKGLKTTLICTDMHIYIYMHIQAQLLSVCEIIPYILHIYNTNYNNQNKNPQHAHVPWFKVNRISYLW